MSASKLEVLCADLELLGLFGVDPNQVQVKLAQAVALLRAFDELAEYALHSLSPPCPVLVFPRIADCTCGLSAAQKKIAAILEGQG